MPSSYPACNRSSSVVGPLAAISTAVSATKLPSSLQAIMKQYLTGLSINHIPLIIGYNIPFYTVHIGENFTLPFNMSIHVVYKCSIFIWCRCIKGLQKMRWFYTPKRHILQSISYRSEVHNLFGPRATVSYFQCTRGPKTKCYMLQFKAELSWAENKNGIFFILLAFFLLVIWYCCMRVV